jgi:hypothetical protein
MKHGGMEVGRGASVPSNVPSTIAVPENCGAGFCTRALGVYAGNDMAKARDLGRGVSTVFGSPTQIVFV